MSAALWEGKGEINLIKKQLFVHTPVHQHQRLSRDEDPGEGKPDTSEFILSFIRTFQAPSQ